MKTKHNRTPVGTILVQEDGGKIREDCFFLKASSSGEMCLEVKTRGKFHTLMDAEELSKFSTVREVTPEEIIKYYQEPRK